MEGLKKRIQEFIEMEHRSGSMDGITPLYVSRMLYLPLDEVEEIMEEL